MTDVNTTTPVASGTATASKDVTSNTAGIKPNSSTPTSDAANASATTNGGDGAGTAPAPAPAAEEAEADIGAESTASVVDMDVFGQLLEIDDDESHEFSKTLAFDYITQAETTFTEIEDALNNQDLDSLSRKGHFLKGSSAALGLQRVQHSCEAMQHFGQRKDENGEGPLMSQDEALRKCRTLLVRLRKEQDQAKEWLESFYKDKA